MLPQAEGQIPLVSRQQDGEKYKARKIRRLQAGPLYPWPKFGNVNLGQYYCPSLEVAAAGASHPVARGEAMRLGIGQP